METMTDRLTRYLLARQRRAARGAIFDKAVDAGLIDVVMRPDAPLVRWQLTDIGASLFRGNPQEDRKRLERLLNRTDGPVGPIGDDAEFDVPADPSAPGETETVRLGRSEETAVPRSTDPGTAQPIVTRDYVLRLLSERVSWRVGAVATALLVARAVGGQSRDLKPLFALLGRSDAAVVVKVPCPRFERHFGLMLEEGLIVPRYTSQGDMFGEEALSGKYGELSDHRRRTKITTVSGTRLAAIGADRRRRQFANLSQREVLPIVIADETATELPAQIKALADVIYEGPGLDPTLIAELLHICAGFAPKDSLKMMTAQDLDLAGLGIDDLVLAIRPGRSLADILAALKQLGEDARSAEAEDGDGEGDGKGHNVQRGIDRKPLRRNLDLIRPVGEKPPGDKPAEESRTDKTGKTDLFVETLSGYGDAKPWALGLKTDVVLWREGMLDWSEMSSRLLLSGPPGTGKTSFARALCNTLQVPLLATSVGRWLEPGYLGDVLKAMARDFDVATENRPCILFIDEIDGIGMRGGRRERSHDDYWSSLINRLLELLDGASRTEGVIVVGATNLPEKIDPALLRSGRLEKHVAIPVPDVDALAGILIHHLGSDLESVLATAAVRRKPVRAAKRQALQRRGSRSALSETVQLECGGRAHE